MTKRYGAMRSPRARNVGTISTKPFTVTRTYRHISTLCAANPKAVTQPRHLENVRLEPTVPAASRTCSPNDRFPDNVREKTRRQASLSNVP
jgi:hypothetical protein